MINILISSLFKTVSNSKTIFQIFGQIMPIKLVYLSWVIFETLMDLEQFQDYCYEKVSLNATICQTADSTYICLHI